MILFWHPTGPLVQYRNGFLHICDLNPELKTQWKMSKTEMFVFGWRCIIATLRGADSQ